MIKNFNNINCQYITETEWLKLDSVRKKYFVPKHVLKPRPCNCLTIRIEPSCDQKRKIVPQWHNHSILSKSNI